MAGLGAPELLIILIVVLVLFGGSRLPKLARSMGQASKEFKEGVKEGAGETDARPDEQVTMSRAELDALLAEREGKPRRDSPPA